MVSEGCELNGKVKDSVIFYNVTTNEGSEIENSVIMQNCKIGKNVRIYNSIVAERAVIGDNAVIGERSFDGESKPITVIGADSVILQLETIPAGQIVDKSITEDAV